MNEPLSPSSLEERRKATFAEAVRDGAVVFAGREDAWNAACRRLAGAGYGGRVAENYARFAPQFAKLASATQALSLAGVVSSTAIRAGRAAAEQLPDAAMAVAGKVGPERTDQWLRLVEWLLSAAPESVAILLGAMPGLFAESDLDGVEAWIRIGVRAADGDPERRQRFFRLEDADSRRWLQRQSGQVGFLDMESRLKPFLAALWGDAPPLRETPPNAPPAARRRSGFDGSVVRLPTTFQGFPPPDSEKLYRAAVAHIGAHLEFSRDRFPLGGLKPAQVALVSLIEDARVERLALRELPGLARLFLPFHTAKPTGTATAPSLFARLARALADPAYDDPDPWVRKGRDAFAAAAGEFEDQRISRRIGDLLGNDLGQMRVQFDPKNYVVQPPYRDDNMGLWDFGEDDPAEKAEAEEVLSSANFRMEEDDKRPPDRVEQEWQPENASGRAHLTVQEADGVLVARYPEFDYMTGRNQADWTSVKEYIPGLGPARSVARLREERAGFANRLTTLIRSARVSRAERLRRQPEGEFLDLDACIDAVISRRIGENPGTRIHARYERRNRDLSTLLLLDISQSTAARVRNGGQTVLDVERQAAALLSQAMAELGDPFAVAAFCSDKREDVRYLRLKDFGSPFDALTEARLAGLESGLSTRLGAAMRHAGQDLALRKTYRRLLLVVTDGEPSDIDVEDRKYLVEDARKAVQRLNRMAIDTFCVGLDSDADSSLGRIFGEHNAITISAVERLTQLLPKLYLRMSR
ncbi:MAG: nitric oxide reductase activation protein NorD [Rhizobiaceae bacterium]|nr:MAG: nitric oxide reductase activation protein NorD [Rhizobiaceae bacterium]